MQITMQSIGTVHSQYRQKKDIPRQGFHDENPIASIHLDEAYAPGLLGLSPGDKIVVLFYFHEAEAYELTFPFHRSGEMRGVFSTRSPKRPNGIGLSHVVVTKIQGPVLEFRNVDMLDGTPVLDIKPDITKD
ncbi:MAG: hypothetical protein AVO33_10290 [delta proteobacterium ML8_F1]|nr:MAG: hypothetical protein AVO33_10290 [delta proteobacterium ML8_F1]